MRVWHDVAQIGARCETQDGLILGPFDPIAVPHPQNPGVGARSRALNAKPFPTRCAFAGRHRKRRPEPELPAEPVPEPG